MAFDRRRFKILQFRNGEIGEVLERVKPLIEKEIKLLFGFSLEDEKPKCPGEENCASFKIAFDDCGDGNEACVGCQWLSTKPKAEAVGTEMESDAESLFLRRVRQIRIERISNGGVIDKSLVTAAEYHSVVIYDSYFENAKVQNDAIQRRLAEENNQMLMVVLKIKG